MRSFTARTAFKVWRLLEVYSNKTVCKSMIYWSFKKAKLEDWKTECLQKLTCGKIKRTLKILITYKISPLRFLQKLYFDRDKKNKIS